MIAKDFGNIFIARLQYDWISVMNFKKALLNDNSRVDHETIMIIIANDVWNATV